MPKATCKSLPSQYVTSLGDLVKTSQIWVTWPIHHKSEWPDQYITSLSDLLIHHKPEWPCQYITSLRDLVNTSQVWETLSIYRKSKWPCQYITSGYGMFKIIQIINWRLHVYMHWHAKKHWSFLPLLGDSAHDTETGRETVKREKKQNINKLNDWPTVCVRQPAGCIWNINKQKQNSNSNTLKTKNKKNTAFRFFWLPNEKYKVKTITTKTFSNQTQLKPQKTKKTETSTRTTVIYHQLIMCDLNEIKGGCIQS